MQSRFDVIICSKLQRSLMWARHPLSLPCRTHLHPVLLSWPDLWVHKDNSQLHGSLTLKRVKLQNAFMQFWFKKINKIIILSFGVFGCGRISLYSNKKLKNTDHKWIHQSAHIKTGGETFRKSSTWFKKSFKSHWWNIIMYFRGFCLEESRMFTVT